MARKGRPSRGRRKIEIKKIENEEARHVCFSKRRIGVFTKASELSTMCGAQVAVVVYSPSGTPYSFGSPSVNSVVDRFLAPSPVRALTDSTHEDVVKMLNKDYMEITDKFVVEKQKKAMLEERAKGVANAKELERLQNIDQIGMDDLDQLLASLNRAKNSLYERINTLLCRSHPANMALFGGTPPDVGSTFRTMAQWAQPPPSSSGAVTGPLTNFVPNPFMPGSH